jgi:anti-anti-sigma factor
MSRPITPPVQAATAIRERREADVPVLQLEGPLHARLGSHLRNTVRTLLCRGERRVVLCLARVATADAAGVGELVRVRNMVVAANGVLSVTNTTERVRACLDCVGLFDLLSTEAQAGDRERAG